jgi:uncharacterized membrane protein
LNNDDKIKELFKDTSLELNDEFENEVLIKAKRELHGIAKSQNVSIDKRNYLPYIIYALIALIAIIFIPNENFNLLSISNNIYTGYFYNTLKSIVANFPKVDFIKDYVFYGLFIILIVSALDLAILKLYKLRKTK